MTGSLADLITSTSNNTAVTTNISSGNGWATGDVIVFVCCDTATGGTCTATAPGASGIQYEQLSVNTNFSGVAGTSGSPNHDGYENQGGGFVVTVWSVRIAAIGTGTGVASVTYGGSSGARRSAVYRLRPESGKTIPDRGSRVRYLYQGAPTDTGGFSLSTVSPQSGSGPGTYDCALLVAGYCTTAMGTAPNYDADGDGTTNGSAFTNVEISTTTQTQSGSSHNTEFNSSGAWALSQLYSTSGATTHRPGSTQKIGWVNTGGSAKAIVGITYLLETPSVSGDAAIGAVASLSATGQVTHYADAAISAAVHMTPSSDKLGQVAIAATASLTAVGQATHYGAVAIAPTVTLTPTGATARLGYINRHAYLSNTGAGDQGASSLSGLPVYLGDLVALLLTTAEADSYADLTPTNCTLRFGNVYTTARPTCTAASAASVTGNVEATFTTSAAHDLVVGQHVTTSGFTSSRYNVTDTVITAVTTTAPYTFKAMIGSGSVPSNATVIGTVQPLLPFDNTNMRGEVDDATVGNYARIWYAKVIAVTGAATVACKLRSTGTPGRATLVSISPGAGNYFNDFDLEVDSGALIRTGNALDHVPWNGSSPWPTNRGFVMLLAGRYSGSARGCDLDFNDDGTFDVTKSGTFAGSTAGPGGGGDLAGIETAHTVATTWKADAYYPYPGISRPSNNNAINHDPDGSGDAAIATLLLCARRTFETAVEVDQAQPITLLKGYPIGTAIEVISNGPGVRGVSGVVPHVGNAVHKARELDIAMPLIVQKSRYITFGLGNPGPGPFKGYTLTAWAYKLGSGDVGDMRIQLMDGSTPLQTSQWFALSSIEAPYSMTITSNVAARSTLRCRVETRSFGTQFSPAVTYVSFFADNSGLGTAIEIDFTPASGVRVRIAGQDFYVNRIQM